MTKVDLINKVFEQIGGTKKEAGDIVEKLFDFMKEVLAGGESIKISGFGNFNVRDKKTRRGRNPQTGDAIEITARRVLTFRPSQILRDTVDTGRSKG
jgi:integration host factor subunit alpha